MRQSQFLDDMGQVLAALFGTAASARGQMRGQAQQRMGLLLQRLQLVGRDEFDALHDMLKAARITQTRLEARLDALEKQRKSKSAAKRPVNESLTKRAAKAKKPAPQSVKTRR